MEYFTQPFLALPIRAAAAAVRAASPLPRSSSPESSAFSARFCRCQKESKTV